MKKSRNLQTKNDCNIPKFFIYHFWVEQRKKNRKTWIFKFLNTNCLLLQTRPIGLISVGKWIFKMWTKGQCRCTPFSLPSINCDGREIRLQNFGPALFSLKLWKKSWSVSPRKQFLAKFLRILSYKVWDDKKPTISHQFSITETDF